MAIRGARNKNSVRVAYAGAALCFTFAALAGAVAAAAASTTAVQSVSVRDYTLSPSTLTVAPNSDVRFTNVGEAVHRIVSDDGTLDTHPLQPGHNATLRFTTLGVFRLHCEIHPTMTMTVTVAASSPANGTSQSATDTNTAAAPTAAPEQLPNTGSGTTVLSVLGLGLILLGMVCLAVGRNSMSPIPAVAAVSSPAMIARVMGWENRFDDLLPGRSSDALRR